MRAHEAATLRELLIEGADVTVLVRDRGGAQHVEATEVVGRLILWLLHPPVRRQVNALSQGTLVINVGSDNLTGHTSEHVRVILRPPRSAPA